MSSSAQFFDQRQRLILRLSVLLLFAISIGWTLLAGKDINFDQLNYHLYGPRLLLEDRWKIDYFAASLQTYLNGVSYLPFYWMVAKNWDDRLIAVTLATAHFLNILLIVRLTVQVATGSGWQKLSLVIIAGVLALVAPMYLVQVGSSFNDPLSSIFVLAALLIYVRRDMAKHDIWSLFFVGGCLGVAVGIKLTNAVFIFGMFAAFFVGFPWERKKRALTLLAIFGLGVLVGFMLLHGYWSWKLFINFGSPIFPYYNNIFQAAEFPKVLIQDKRFLDGGWLGLFFLPFQMIRSEAWIYTETIAPDLRLAALVVLLFFLMIFRLRERLRCEGKHLRFSEPDFYKKTVMRITVFWIVSFLIWGGLFRIGRYALVLWLLIPVLIIVVLQVACFGRRSVAIGVAIILAQIFLIFQNKIERWEGVDWSGHWLNFDVPYKISENPGIFVSLETQSLSAIGTKLSKTSSLVNLTGQYVHQSGAEMSSRLLNILQDESRPIYLMRSFNRAEQVIRAIDWIRIDWSGLNSVLMPYGLKVGEGEKCERGALNFKPTTFFADGKRQGGYEIFFCRLQRATQREMLDAVATQTRFDQLFDRIERSCPRSFYPPGAHTVLTNGQYVRSYFNTGTHMLTSQGVLYAGALRRLELVALADLQKPLAELLNTPVTCPPNIVERFLR